VIDRLPSPPTAPYSLASTPSRVTVSVAVSLVVSRANTVPPVVSTRSRASIVTEVSFSPVPEGSMSAGASRDWVSHT